MAAKVASVRAITAVIMESGACSAVHRQSGIRDGIGFG